MRALILAGALAGIVLGQECGPDMVPVGTTQQGRACAPSKDGIAAGTVLGNAGPKVAPARSLTVDQLKAMGLGGSTAPSTSNLLTAPGGTLTDSGVDPTKIVTKDANGNVTIGTTVVNPLAGTDPTGTTDSYAGFQAAINAAVASSRQTCVIVPPGKYLLSAPLVAAPGGENMPVNGLCFVSQTPGSVGYDSFPTYTSPNWTDGTTQFVVSGGFSGDVVIDLRYTSNAIVSGISVSGNSGANCIEVGNRTNDGKGGGFDTIQNSSFRGCSNALAANNSLGLKLYGNQFSSSLAGVYMNNMTDGDYRANWINSNQVNYAGGSILPGAGLYCLGCTNSNITGGKIEDNAKGIVLDGSSGIVVSGIIFQDNPWGNIIGLGNSVGNTIAANQFYGGGTYYSSGLSVGYASISIYQAASSPQRFAITGNAFQADTFSGVNGPVSEIISLAGGNVSAVAATVTGNMMQYGCPANIAIAATGNYTNAEVAGNSDLGLSYTAAGGASIVNQFQPLTVDVNNLSYTNTGVQPSYGSPAGVFAGNGIRSLNGAYNTAGATFLDLFGGSKNYNQTMGVRLKNIDGGSPSGGDNKSCFILMSQTASVLTEGNQILCITDGSVVTLPQLTGSGSRPLCVTPTGVVEAGSLSAGLTTCP